MTGISKPRGVDQLWRDARANWLPANAAYDRGPVYISGDYLLPGEVDPVVAACTAEPCPVCGGCGACGSFHFGGASCTEDTCPHLHAD